MASNRTETKFHVVHCAATRAKQDVGAKTINKWHLQRGIYSERGLTGYHHIIRRSGYIELGRDLAAHGAHAIPINSVSVGTCLVGGARKAKESETPEWEGLVSDDNFMPAQKQSLRIVHMMMLKIWPDIIIAPHYAFAPKSCPSFDVWEWEEAVFGTNSRDRFMAAYEDYLMRGLDEDK